MNFWVDNCSSLWTLEELTDHRGHIDLDISATSSIANVLKMHRRKHHRSEILNLIEDSISTLRSGPVTLESDVSLWKFQGDKYKLMFVTKQTWLQIRQSQPQVSWFRGIWFSYATLKFSFTTWLATLNRPPTADRMGHWNASQSSECILCRNFSESRDHLFFDCAFSQRIWESLTKQLLKMDYTNDWVQIQYLLNRPSTSRIHTFILWCVFSISTLPYMEGKKLSHAWRKTINYFSHHQVGGQECSE